MPELNVPATGKKVKKQQKDVVELADLEEAKAEAIEEDFGRMSKEDLLEAGYDAKEQKELKKVNKDFLRSKPNYNELVKYYENMHPHVEYDVDE